MATYALTFATRAAFDTSLASGDIYNLMQGVTSGKPSVAITATITESGETFACGTNVMVDIKSVGPGDYVMYDSTNNKFFGIASKWIDNNYPNQPTQHIMIFKAGVLPARYVVCGTVIKRFGNRIRLAGEQASKPWSTTAASGYAWNVSSIPTTTYIVKKSRTTTTTINTAERTAFCSNRYQERYYPSGNASYLPIRRSTWDAAVNSGATTVTENGKTATMADYNNSYDKFLEYNFSPLFPSLGLFSDIDAMGNTRKIVADFVANHGKTEASEDFAAGYCYNYAVSAPGLGARQWFLGSMKDVFEVRVLSYTLRIPISWAHESFVTCCQSGGSTCWTCPTQGMSYSYYKNDLYYAVPLADLILEN